MTAARSRSFLLPLSVALFALGLGAILSIFGLSTFGYTNLPLWLNLAAMLAPAGLIIGVVATVLRTRARSGKP